MSHVITACFLLAGIINFIPIVGVLSKGKLEQLYGVSIDSKELSILLRHRAVLFGILGGFILYAAFVPAYQGLALVLGYTSMFAFLVIALPQGPTNREIRKVVIADLLALAAYAVATVLWFLR